MAFKDEYEVARTGTATPLFAALLRKSSSRGFKINYHMAPPIRILAQDARGARLS